MCIQVNTYIHRVCTCICRYINTYVCIVGIYVYIYTSTPLYIYCRYIFVYVYIYTHSQFIGMYTCKCTNTSSACSYICNMYTHKHLCIYCRYICTYIYIYIHSRFIGMYTCKCTYTSSACSYICNIVLHENSFHPTYRDKKDRDNKNESVGSEVQFQFKHSTHCHEQHTVMNNTPSRTAQRRHDLGFSV